MFRSGLLLAFGVYSYAIFSSPWPQSMGIGEIVSSGFFLLFCIVSLQRKCRDIHVRPGVRKVYLATVFYVLGFLILSSIPLIDYRNTSFASYMRDFIPYFFIFLLPASIAFIANKEIELFKITSFEQVSRLLILYIFLPGSILAFRAIAQSGFVVDQLGQKAFYENLDYKQYDPLVIFTLLCSVPMSFSHLSRGQLFSSLFYFISFALTGISLSIVSMRQPLVSAVIVLLIYIASGIIRMSNSGGVGLSKRLSRQLLITVLVLCVLIAIPRTQAIFQGIFNQLMQKTELVGENGKMTELFDIVRLTNDSWIGQGLGTLYYNSALGFYARFTHSLLTYPLLKAGYLGLLATLAYVIYVIHSAKESLSLCIKKAWDNDLLKILLLSLLALLLNSLAQVIYKPISFSLVIGFTLGCLFRQKPLNGTLNYPQASVT